MCRRVGLDRKIGSITYLSSSCLKKESACGDWTFAGGAPRRSVGWNRESCDWAESFQRIRPIFEIIRDLRHRPFGWACCTSTVTAEPHCLVHATPRSGSIGSSTQEKRSESRMPCLCCACVSAVDRMHRATRERAEWSRLISNQHDHLFHASTKRQSTHLHRETLVESSIAKDDAGTAVCFVVREPQPQRPDAVNSRSAD